MKKNFLEEKEKNRKKKFKLLILLTILFFFLLQVSTLSYFLIKQRDSSHQPPKPGPSLNKKIQKPTKEQIKKSISFVGVDGSGQLKNSFEEEGTKEKIDYKKAKKGKLSNGQVISYIVTPIDMYCWKDGTKNSIVVDEKVNGLGTSIDCSTINDDLLNKASFAGINKKGTISYKGGKPFDIDGVKITVYKNKKETYNSDLQISDKVTWVFKLKNPNDCWSDNTKEPKKLSKVVKTLTQIVEEPKSDYFKNVKVIGSENKGKLINQNLPINNTTCVISFKTKEEKPTTNTILKNGDIITWKYTVKENFVWKTNNKQKTYTYSKTVSGLNKMVAIPTHKFINNTIKFAGRNGKCHIENEDQIKIEGTTLSKTITRNGVIVTDLNSLKNNDLITWKYTLKEGYSWTDLEKQERTFNLKVHDLSIPVNKPDFNQLVISGIEGQGTIYNKYLLDPTRFIGIKNISLFLKDKEIQNNYKEFKNNDKLTIKFSLKENYCWEDGTKKEGTKEIIINNLNKEIKNYNSNIVQKNITVTGENGHGTFKGLDKIKKLLEGVNITYIIDQNHENGKLYNGDIITFKFIPQTGYAWKNNNKDSKEIIFTVSIKEFLMPSYNSITQNGENGKIFEDSKQNIWAIGYNTALEILKKGTYKWEVVKDKKGNPIIERGDRTMIFEDSKNNIWVHNVSSNAEELKCLPKGDFNNSWIFPKDKQGKKLKYKKTKMFEDSDHNLWLIGGNVLQTQKPLMVLKNGEENWEPAGHGSQIKSYYGGQIFEDSKQNLWAMGTGGELQVKRKGQNNWTQTKHGSNIKEQQSVEYSGKIVEDTKNNIIWAMRDKAMQSLDLKNPNANWKDAKYDGNNFIVRGFGGNMFKDSDGNIWAVGAAQSSLAEVWKLKQGNQKWENIKLPKRATEEKGSSFFEDKDNNIYLLISENPLLIFNKTSNKFEKQSQSAIGPMPTTGASGYMMQDHNGSIWAMGKDQRIYIEFPNYKRWICVYGNQNEII